MLAKRRNFFFVLSLILNVSFLGASAQSKPLRLARGLHFNRAFVVIFENTEYGLTIQQPFFRQLADRGANFNNFFAISRPSQPNYLALTSGTTSNVRSNNDVNLNITNLVDLLEARGLSWRVYAEDYPGNCFVGTSAGGYARKHNPFISYLNIQKNPQRCSNIVNSGQLDADVSNGFLADFSFYIPNNRNSAHDTDIRYADRWFAQRFGPFVSNPAIMRDMAFITTFDEGSFWKTRNQIYTTIVGPAVKPGTYSDQLNLFSLLKLLEENWGLGNLGREDAKAASIPNIWQ